MFSKTNNTNAHVKSLLLLVGWIYICPIPASTTSTRTTDKPSQPTTSTIPPYNCSDKCLPAPTQPPTFPVCDPVMNGTQPCLNETGESGTGQSDSCDWTTGQCLYGCVEKYLAGPYCNLSCEEDLNCDQCAYDEGNDRAVCAVCKNNFFKQAGYCQACSKNCRSDNGTTNQRCDMEDGSCSRGCTDGTYGLKCTQDCHALCRPRVCDQFTGCCRSETCVRTDFCGCACATFCSRKCLGGSCNRDCTCEKGCEPNGYYGPHCDLTCPDTCLSVPENATQTCNDTNGHCLHGCVSPSVWGVMCDKNCSGNCLNGTCDQNTGACTDGCVSQEWHGTHCSKRCSSKCAAGGCNRITGTCLQGCINGYRGEFCELACRQNCKNNVCDMNNGTCVQGCANGYYSDTCDRTCHINCANDTCEFTSGKCSLGCKTCFRGEFCQTACDGPKYWYWIVAVCVGVLVVLVGVVIVWRRCRATKQSNNTPDYVNNPGTSEYNLHQTYETLATQSENHDHNYAILNSSSLVSK